MMQAINVLLAGTGFLAGTWFLYFCLVRSRAVADIRSRVLDLSKSFWIEAQEANLTTDPHVIEIYNRMIELAALAPYIATGIVLAHPAPLPSEKKMEEALLFFKRNRWVMAYVFTTGAALDRLEFHAKPWVPRRVWNAAFGYVIMKSVANRFEPSCFPPQPQKVVQQAQKLECFTPAGDHFTFA